ncbi:hypothetical protein SAMN02746065_11949 [Desulfocicer vacuolatum DSM 3385]|uniref:Cytidylate kinase n=1 Tax=Desulfocicer vacuolatum DSM 3385 TaxID=1121400 RepID=A0A1W2DPF7_9BACT|nr:hypothetical protein [Desulfocicer vacuolatum]SMC99360.1 hypothetical protein SAMN02746065_11949 [Desulfocicer vacuolatum DSM 3385]
MSVLIFTSDNQELEEKIARQSAEKLGYKTLNHRFLDDIARQYSLDSAKLREAMITTPSILKRMSSKMWHYYLSCVETAVLDRLLEDDIVCWGLGAHLYVLVVSHVLKVRLVGGDGSASMTDTKKERQREKWSVAAWQRREADPRLYDLVINLDQIKSDEAVNTVTSTVGYPRFKPMTYSRNTLTDRALAAKVKNALLETLTNIHVHAQNGTVVVTTTSLKREKAKKVAAIKEIAGKVEGMGYLEVHWNVDMVSEAALGHR